jgi:spore coat protein U-like protein
MTRCWQKLALLLIVAMAPFAARGAVCTISSTALNFGTYTGSTINATNTITTNCPASVSSYTISLNAGTGAGAITQIRFMTLTYELVYQMFQNSSRTTNWGNTVGTDTVSVTGNTGSNVVSTVYAQLPSGQVPPPGTYTDTITVSVTSTLGTQTGTFAVSAIVSPYCTISANPLAFGTYSGAQLNVNSTVTVHHSMSGSTRELPQARPSLHAA